MDYIDQLTKDLDQKYFDMLNGTPQDLGLPTLTSYKEFENNSKEYYKRIDREKRDRAARLEAQRKQAEKDREQAEKDRKEQARIANEKAAKQRLCVYILVPVVAFIAIIIEAAVMGPDMASIPIAFAIIAVAILVVVVSIFVINHSPQGTKFSLNKIDILDKMDIKVVKKTNGGGGVDLHLHIKNNGSESICGLDGYVLVYKGGSNFLLQFNGGYTGCINPGKSADFVWHCREYLNINNKIFHDAEQIFHDADLSELQIVYMISSYSLIGKDVETLVNNKKKIIKPYNPYGY